MASPMVLWLLLLAPLFLVPLALYVHHYVRVDPSTEKAEEVPRRVPKRGVETRPGVNSHRTTVACQYCGTVNESRYEFCEECLGRLR